MIYSVVYGVIFGALFPDYLRAALAFGVSAAGAVALIAPALVVTLGGLSYNARLRTGAFEFKRGPLTIVGPILAAAMLTCTLYESTSGLCSYCSGYGLLRISPLLFRVPPFVVQAGSIE